MPSPKDPYALTWRRQGDSEGKYYIAETTVKNLHMVFTISRVAPGTWLLEFMDMTTEFHFDTLDTAKRFAAGYMGLLKLVKQ